MLDSRPASSISFLWLAARSTNSSHPSFSELQRSTVPASISVSFQTISVGVPIIGRVFQRSKYLDSK